MRRPSICCAIIARNEERDIVACVESVRDIVERIVLIDTGSTDRTVDVAIEAAGNVPIRCERYLEACEPDPNRPGEYRIVNFSLARNRALERARESGCSHILWMDADDVVETPLAVRRAAWMPRGIYGMWIELDRSGQRQVHHRLFPVDA